jgi:hypoxanthine phosphoribosyltransferase
MIPTEEAKRILDTAEMIYSADEMADTVMRMAADITLVLSDRYPLVLSVMRGGVMFAGQLLPLLKFPLDFDYIHASRYHDNTTGSQIEWKAMPSENVQGRVVLVLDDILDEGITLEEIRKRIMRDGAAAFYSAVLTNKDIGRPKPISADFVGVLLPNRYVFGFGMDVHGAWRNLPAIYAMKE